jgi:hypothetical protein
MTNRFVAPFGWETLACSSRAYHIASRYPCEAALRCSNKYNAIKIKGIMAEWLMRGTVNTFFRGSIPLDTCPSLRSCSAWTVRNKANVLKLVNNLLLSRSGSNSLRVQVSLFVIIVSKIV